MNFSAGKAYEVFYILPSLVYVGRKRRGSITLGILWWEVEMQWSNV